MLSLLGSSLLLLVLRHDTWHMEHCGHGNFPVGQDVSDTQFHASRRSPESQAHILSIQGSLGHRDSRVILQIEHDYFPQLFLRRPVLFLVCLGRWFSPTWYRLPLHSLGQVVLKVPVVQALLAPPSLHLFHPCQAVHLDHHGHRYHLEPSPHQFVGRNFHCLHPSHPIQHFSHPLLALHLWRDYKW